MILQAIETVLDGHDLTAAQAGAAMGAIMDGAASPVQVSAYLSALRAKGESVEEIVGSARVMRDRALEVAIDDHDAVDLCGTGGDGMSTFNISTTACFVAVGAGCTVAKHGNRAASSRSGSADVLEALGANLALSPGEAADCCKTTGVGFFFAPAYHPAMRFVAPVRRELGMRTIFNLLGPLCNPAHVKAQLLGVFAEHLVEPLAHVCAGLGLDRAVVVHGLDGYDEATTVGPSRVARLAGGEVTSFLLDPADLGFPRADPGSLEGGSPEENAEIARRILGGEPGPRRDTVVLNAGLAILVAGKAASLSAGLRLAEKAIASGRALEALQGFVAFTQALTGVKA